MRNCVPGPKIVIALLPLCIVQENFLSNYFHSTESTNFLPFIQGNILRKEGEKKEREIKSSPDPSRSVHCPTTSKLEFSAFAVTGVPFPYPPPFRFLFQNYRSRGWLFAVKYNFLESLETVGEGGGLKHDSGWKGIRVKSRISPL